MKDKQTGKCLVSLNEAGVPMYDLLQDTAYDHIPLTTSVEADVLYFGTLALRSEHNRHTLQQLFIRQTVMVQYCKIHIIISYSTHYTLFNKVIPIEIYI